ncbi:MAG: hypothetical protein R3E97_13005 [Candidatus Eisenbacteria bacterium]
MDPRIVVRKVVVLELIESEREILEGEEIQFGEIDHRRVREVRK